MKQVISRLGAKFGRPQKELDELVERLTQNWITHLSHWKALPQAQREQFKLPLLLLHELAHIIGEDEDAGEAMAVCPPPQRPSTKRSRTEKVDKKGKDIDVEAPVKRAKMHAASEALPEVILNPKYAPGEASMAEVKATFDKTIGDPFPHALLRDVFDERFLEGLKEEVMELHYLQKSNDLYDFLQSNDLKGCTLPHVSKLKDLLYSADFRTWLQGITGIEELNDTIDMSCARYIDGSTLLCHDDELEGRRIAYILYLVPKDWKEEDGGTLDLFGVDEHNEPNSIVASYTPAWNSLFFFEVNPVSYHQVAEVLSADKERLSISGWFHGPPITRPPHYQEPPLPETEPIPTQQVVTVSSSSSAASEEELAAKLLAEWLDPIYLDPKNVKDIAAEFEEEQSIELHNFLNADKFVQLVEVLHDQPWDIHGPANKRHYQILPDGKENDIVKQCKRFLHSQAFFDYLKKLTQADLIKCSSQIRCFRPGAYTLVHDQATEEMALDVTLCCATNNIPLESGGQLIYMDSDTELLTVPCNPNSLALTFRDPGTMRFIKYMNHHCHDIRYDFSLIFKEEKSDEDDDGNAEADDNAANSDEEEADE
jgi:Rps23 Pro-64 3,4-dihydroxylase Tpa1-like proline 4-hydroxylase